MADITWSIYGSSNFSPEELECARNGGSWDRATSTCSVARGLPPSEPLAPVVSGGQLGSIDPDQMFADGFVYVQGQWVRWDSAAAIAAGQPQTGGGRAGSASVLPAFSSGPVLGYDIPAASPVALPSFVGGLLGTVRLAGGMRPASGGDPNRVVMGPGSSVFPRVRLGVTNWGR